MLWAKSYGNPDTQVGGWSGRRNAICHGVWWADFFVVLLLLLLRSLLLPFLLLLLSSPTQTVART